MEPLDQIGPVMTRPLSGEGNLIFYRANIVPPFFVLEYVAICYVCTVTREVFTDQGNSAATNK
jgi:hypothetical protein